MEFVQEFWYALGPLGPCLIIFATGCLMVLGFIFKWEWIYPGHIYVRDCSSTTLRILTLLGGIVLMICSVIFYAFRDSYTW